MPPEFPPLCQRHGSGGLRWEGGVPWAHVSAIDLWRKLHVYSGDILREDGSARTESNG